MKTDCPKITLALANFSREDSDFVISQNVTKRGNIQERQKALIKETRLELAETIMGQDFYGPEAFQKVFEIELDRKTMPKMPFTLAELREAKQAGMFLIFRVGSLNGEPFTIEEMLVRNEKLRLANQGSLIVPPVRKMIANTGWALVGKKMIDGSETIEPWRQTLAVVKYAYNTIHRHDLAPVIERIFKEYSDYPQQDNNHYHQSKANQFRRSTAEIIYDHFVRSACGGRGIMIQRELSSHGAFVELGPGGQVHAYGRIASNKDRPAGVTFQRRF